MSGDSDTESIEAEPEKWIRIQKDTFTNWVNNALRPQGTGVTDIKHDFKDGVKLCKLMTALKKVNSIGRVIQKEKMNTYESSGNLALALQAMNDDGVRLVNIGAEDIAGGNLKLILGMIWVLIRKYQIGSESKIPPKKLMLAWINAVLHPNMQITNFSTDWNDGVALHGIVEYCKPGTYPTWMKLHRTDKLNNCSNAIELADRELKIPRLISPENLASPELDELSGMTYLSLFMAQDAPGYGATLKWVQHTVKPTTVSNFDSDWNDGKLLANLCHSLGAEVPNWPNWDTSNKERSCRNAMNISEGQLGVPPVITAKDMCSLKIDHIGPMAYAAWHQAKTAQLGTQPPTEPEPEPTPEPPPPPPAPMIIPVVTPPTPPQEPEPVPEPEPEPEPIEPPSPPGAGLPAVVAVNFNNNTRIDSSNTISIDSTDAGEGDIRVTAYSPSNDIEDLPVKRTAPRQHSAVFKPNEPGTWKLEVFYAGTMVQGSPHFINVYDPAKALIIRETHNSVPVGKPTSFEVDCMQAGTEDVDVFVTHRGETVSVSKTQSGLEKHKFTFTPLTPGLYSVKVLVGGIELPDSPFDIEVVQPEAEIGVSGSGITKGLKGIESFFFITASGSMTGQVQAQLVGPSGNKYQCYMMPDGAGRYKVKYQPAESGHHKVEVLYNGSHISGSPYPVFIKEPEVYIRNLPKTAYVGVESRFELDASEMQKGTIEIDSDIPVRKYDKLGDNRYMVTIVPRFRGQHDMIVKYDGKVVGEPSYVINVQHRP